MVSKAPPVLPIELFRPIVQHLTSTRELYPLLLASRALQLEATRGIYHSIAVRPGGKKDGDIGLIEHLASSQFAGLVRTFEIPKVLRQHVQKWDSYWSTIRSALQAMTGLQYLRIDNPISFGDSMDTSQHSYLLQGCTFRLRSLIFKSIQSNYIGQLESLAPCLEELICSHPNTTFRPSDGVVFPKMRIVGLHPELLYNGLLKAMPHVHALAWTAGVAKPEWVTVQPFHRIKLLDVYLHAPGFFVDIVACFPEVVYVKATVQSSDIKAVVTPTDVLKIRSKGNGMLALRKVYLQMVNHRCVGSAYSSLFEVYPTLDCIELHCSNQDILLRKELGAEDGYTLEEAGPNPDEWKEECWLSK